jgi:glucosyl-3-phosphoglycerate phosphatase
VAGGEPAVSGVGPDRSLEHVVRLVLWRHGQTAWNVQRRFQGLSDIPLDATGHDQARDAARYLAAMHPGAIFSSDLIRAAETAAYLGELTGLPVQLDKDLRERGGGSWEGLTDREIREGYPAEYAAWVPPDGEPVSAVADRAAGALERIADSLDGQGGPDGKGGLGGEGGRDGRDAALAVVISHGAAINLGLSRLLGLPERTRVLGPLGNCSWSVLGRRAGRWRLLEHNVGRLPDLAPEPVPVLAAGPEEETPAHAPGPGSAPGSGR